MPIGYLDVPTGLDLDKKRALVHAMYEALRDDYPFPEDHRIFLNERHGNSVSQDSLLGSEPPRPVFLIHAPQGVNANAKRKTLKNRGTRGLSARRRSTAG